MRFKKLVSMFAAAAVTVSCMAGMFAFNAGAYTVISPSQIKVTVDGSELSYKDYLFTKGNIPLTLESVGQSMPTRLTNADLVAMKSINNTYPGTDFVFTFIDKVNGITYKATVHGDQLTPDDGDLDLALGFTSGKTESGTKYLDVRNGSLQGRNIVVTYRINSFSGVASQFDVIPGKTNQYYLFIEDPVTHVMKLNGNIGGSDDANFYLGNDGLVDARVFVRFTVDLDDKYYTKAEVEELIKTMIEEKLGFTGDDAGKTVSAYVNGKIEELTAGVSESSLKDYIDGLIKDIKNDLYDADGNVKYLTESEVNTAISNYFNNPDNLSSYLDELLKISGYSAIIAAIGEAFGDSTTSIQTDAIMNYIWAGILAQAISGTSGYDISAFRTLVPFFAYTWAAKELSTLKSDLETLKAKVDTTDLQLTQILKDLKDPTSELYKALKGAQGATGKTAFEEARDRDVVSNYSEWLELISGSDGTNGESFEEWINRNYPVGGIDQFITEKILPKIGAYGYGSDIWPEYENGVRVWYTRDNRGNLIRLGTNVPYGYGYGSGESAYDIAVRNGYRGTEKQWLESLQGASAYEIAVNNGFRGTEREWLESLKGEDGRDGQDGQDGKDGKDGRDGRDGRDGLDGQDGRVTYVYGYSGNSAAPKSTATNDTSKTSDDVVLVMDDKGGSYTTTRPASRSANPATGAAAGILIPGAAVASIVLLKKDKRKRGKRK